MGRLDGQNCSSWPCNLLKLFLIHLHLAKELARKGSGNHGVVQGRMLWSRQVTTEKEGCTACCLGSEMQGLVRGRFLLDVELHPFPPEGE